MVFGLTHSFHFQLPYEVMKQYHTQSLPEHSDANPATANGNANITATVTAIQVMITL